MKLANEILERMTPPPPPKDQTKKLRDEIRKLDKEFKNFSDRQIGLSKQSQAKGLNPKDKKSQAKAAKAAQKDMQAVFNKRDKLQKKLDALEIKFK